MNTLPASEQPGATSSRPGILLVDDNPAVRQALSVVFQVAGFRVDTAEGPAEAFSRLAESPYDAILLDLNFGPGKTGGDEGLACLRRIMAEDPKARVVVITAHSGIRIAVAAMQLGARDFVMKPWRNSELIEKINAAIASDPEPAGASAQPPAVRVVDPARILGESPPI